MELKIEQAREEDLPFIETRIKEYLLDGRDLRAEDFILARSQDKILGFVRIINHPQFYEPCSLWVTSKFRNQGVGNMLMERILLRATEPKPIYSVTHIPEYFTELGFETVTGYPRQIKEKIETICKYKSRMKVMRYKPKEKL